MEDPNLHIPAQETGVQNPSRRDFLRLLAGGVTLAIVGGCSEDESKKPKTPEDVIADSLNPDFDPEERYGEGTKLQYEHQSQYGFNLRVFSDKDNFVQDGATLEEILMAGINNEDHIIQRLEDLVAIYPSQKSVPAVVKTLISEARKSITEEGLFKGITLNLFVPSKPNLCITPPELAGGHSTFYESTERECPAIGTTIRPQIIDSNKGTATFIDTIEMTIASGYFGEEPTQPLFPYGIKVDFNYAETMTSTLAHEGAHLWLRPLTNSNPDLSSVRINEAFAQAVEYGLADLVSSGAIPSAIK